MSNFFREFPSVDYRFGDNTSTSLFKQMNLYIDIIDQIKDIPSYYQEYVIGEGERPDNVSNVLYGTPYYHWTFFLLNDKLRESGWPVSNMEIYQLAQQYFPNDTIVTETDISSTFLAGSQVTGLSSTATGTIINRRLGLGQINVAVSSGTFSRNELIQDDEGNLATVFSISKQYLSTYAYYDADGFELDINPYDQNFPSVFSELTQTERMIQKNNELKTIKVLKKETVASVVSEYKRILRRNNV